MGNIFVILVHLLSHGEMFIIVAGLLVALTSLIWSPRGVVTCGHFANRPIVLPTVSQSICSSCRPNEMASVV